MCFRYAVIRAALLLVGLLAFAGAARAQAPVITTQPASQTVDIGTTDTLSVVATNATGYRWYQGTTALTDGGDFSGSLSAALKITNAQAADSGSFTVVVSNASGYVTSSAAIFTAAVLHAPTITSPLTLSVVPEVPFTYTITGTDLPTSFGATVPTGLTFDAATGTLSGAIAAAGTTTVPISAGNSLGTTNASLVITAAPPATQFAATLVSTFGAPMPTGLCSILGVGLFASYTSLDYVSTGPNLVIGASGEVGSTDGPAASARFFHPTGLAADAYGNLYIADTGNDTIRVYSGGNVATLAGSPQASGSIDATGSAARFSGPTALAVGADGTVYVADTGNDTIRKITTGGVVTTLAGSAGQAGSMDGTGSVARFSAPVGIAVDAAGNVYVADSGNYTVRKITPGGVVTTFAGTVGQSASTDGTGAAASFTQVGGLAFDPSGNLYVGDAAVREITPGGNVTTLGPIVPSLSPVNTNNYMGLRYNLPVVIAVEQLTGITVDAQGDIFFVNDSTTVYSNGIVELKPFIPLSLVSSPASQEVFVGDAALFNFTVAGSNPQYIWFPVGFPISGMSPENDVVVSTANAYQPPTNEDGLYSPNEIGDSGSYTVYAYNAGSYVAGGASVELLETPNLLLTGTIAVGQPATLTCYVSAVRPGGPPATGLSYQWSKNGTPIPGATDSTLSFTALALTDAGQYQVLVTTPSGDTRPAFIGAIIDFTGNNPVVTTPPVSQTVYPGGLATFTVAANGANLTYQWLLDGVAIPGATNATYTISAAAVANAGSYSVSVSQYGEVTTTTPVTLDVNMTRLVNLSVRGTAGSGADALIVGFVTSGSAPMQLLLRGIGPGLASFGVAGVLAQPQLDLYSSTGTLLATNAGWGGDADLAAAFSAVGAFPLSTSSADSALLVPEVGGAYTAQVTGLNGGQGNALAEIYDADTGSPAQHLLNLSARGAVGTGAAILIGGFVVTGNASETVLVRGIGPGLGTFGLAGVLGHPVISVLDSTGKVLATNTVWGGTAALSAAFSQVGAFSLAADSLDSALLLKLPPGAYTAQLNGANMTTGLGLLEIYEVR
jgi:hypothetical protein